MTRRQRLPALILALLALFLLNSCKKEADRMTVAPANADPGSPVMMHLQNPDTEVRGVWIASVYNIDYPASASLSDDELKKGLDDILDTCEEVGLNTVFFQVRPSCDALYRSEIFPVSKYLSAERKMTFDPLGYLVDAAHHRNIFVYAWVNPLRVTVAEGEELPADSPAAVFPEWTVNYGGKLVLDPGLPEVRRLVADGVEEIVTNYSVDGVVFDDYFYPYAVTDESGKTVPFGDDDSFKKYGREFKNRDDWRRDNVNDLIRQCWYAVHAVDPDCKFGVSPTGVWSNDNGKNGGSDTRGYDAYLQGYCDALAWVKEGTVDFLSPQIYWDFNTAATPFDVLTRWWNTALEGTGVQLWISHASYRYEEGEWADPTGQLAQQIAFARSEHSYRGSVCYGYDEIHRNIRGAADDLRSAYRDEIIYTDIISNGLAPQIAAPADGSVLYDPQTYIVGASDPYYPLTVNGEKVGRTKSGAFSLYVTLKPGENRFVFEQNGAETVLILHYGDSHLKADESQEEVTVPEETEQEIRTFESLALEDPYPVGQISTREGILWVSCTAPYGAKVRAEIGGGAAELSPIETPPEVKSGYAAVKYAGTVPLPEVGDDEILDCGKVIFTASLPDAPEETVTAEGCSVRDMGKNAAICVRATHDYTSLKITETSSYYNDYTVQSEGMTGYAIHQRNGFYLLSMGGYLSEEDAEEVSASNGQTRVLSVIESAEVTDCGKTTELRFRCTGKPAYNGAIDENGRFAVTFFDTEGASELSEPPEPVIGENPLIRSGEAVQMEGKVRYTFELYAAENFYGFDLRYEDGDTVVSLRNPIAADLSAERPLAGVKLVLDAGHGGWDNGAAGALPGLAEKDLNLLTVNAASEKLKELGAEVILLREGDEVVDLYARMDRLEELEPDLCVSIHQNSMGYASDITRIRGTLALWTTEAGRMLSDCVGRAAAGNLNRLYRGSQYQALAVCRNPKFPATLIEMGFMTSVEEYELSVSECGLDRAADGVVSGILDYFARMTEYAGR